MGAASPVIVPNIVSPIMKGISAIGDWFTGGDKKTDDKVKTSELEETLHIKLNDGRKIRMTTGKKINPNRDLKGGDYILNDIQQALKIGKQRGLSKEDLYNLAAMDLAETGWGNTDNQMGHVLNGRGDTFPEKFVNAYIDKMKYADDLHVKDPMKRLQIYNGNGWVYPKTEKKYHGFEMKDIYGVPIGKGIDLSKNPLYGKEVTDLRENVLKKNPRFVSFMNNLYDSKKQGGEINWINKYK
jgi:hypothetical protein